MTRLDWSYPFLSLLILTLIATISPSSRAEHAGYGGFGGGYGPVGGQPNALSAATCMPGRPNYGLPPTPIPPQPAAKQGQEGVQVDTGSKDEMEAQRTGGTGEGGVGSSDGTSGKCEGGMCGTTEEGKDGGGPVAAKTPKARSEQKAKAEEKAKTSGVDLAKVRGAFRACLECHGPDTDRPYFLDDATPINSARIIAVMESGGKSKTMQEQIKALKALPQSDKDALRVWAKSEGKTLSKF